MTDSDIKKDYQDFVSSHSIPPPQHLSDKILDMIETDLSPSHLIVFSKLFAIQAFIGFVSLIFCPQFSFSLTNNFEVFHYFHYQFGEEICMAICGSIFIGSGAIFASYLLRVSEVRKIRHSRFLYYLSISAAFVSLFLLAGAKVYLPLAAYWSAGAIISGTFLFSVNQWFRQKHLSY